MRRGAPARHRNARPENPTPLPTRRKRCRAYPRKKGNASFRRRFTAFARATFETTFEIFEPITLDFEPTLQSFDPTTMSFEPIGPGLKL